MKLIIFIVSLLYSLSIHTQIFLETFDESNTSTIGFDNVGSVQWTTTCASCIDLNDWFYVRSNKLEGRDTNGPAEFQTSPIDISSCNGVEINLDISEVGTMEPCGTGCNSADFISVQYRVDGGIWIDPSNSYFCPGNCAGLNVIYDDDVTSTLNYSTDCFPSGNTLEIKIIVQNWAGSEYWEIDNISVDCAPCSALPVGLSFFKGENIQNHNLIEWETFNEVNNDYFYLERSLNGLEWELIKQIEGAGTTTNSIYYDFKDYTFKSQLNYYRLTQVDYNGEISLFNPIVIDNSTRKPKIIKQVNILGQKINPSHFGIIIEIYTDGSVKKTFIKNFDSPK